MTIASELEARAGGNCELCGAAGAGEVFAVGPDAGQYPDKHILICGTCLAQTDPAAELNVHHWRALNESMWSQVAAVQVMAWRMLQRLRDEAWARDLSDMLYLEDDVLAWARRGEAGASDDAGEEELVHRDSNGAVLAAGDAVTLTKDLNVKGTSFVAKRGTVVRNIRLVPNNAAQIEGRVNGQQIVILTEFVKK